ncbi:MAG TPA: penicillin-binding protein 2 [Pyrinomonadaceae bacterium]|nr:penicillin-binding protein 2 [Pyrinomonadaceae bacterium]
MPNKRRRKKGFDSRQTAFLRYMLIVALLLVWIGGISARLVYLQVNQHEWLKSKASSQRIDVTQTKMPRGTIYDRNGRALAVSINVKTLFADAMQIDDVEKTAADVARVLNGNKEKIREQLYEAKDLEKRYVPLVKGLDEVAAQQMNAALETEGIRKADLPRYPGLYWREEQKRSYPHQSLAAHVIGFSNADGVGQAGIEQSQNDALYGAIIRKEQERDRLGRVYDERVTEKEPPKDIALTISTSIQHRTEVALEKAAKASAARAAMAIVLDHKTGEILALANYPTFDPNKLEGINAENLSNRCIQGVYAPGSVFKLITYSTAMEKQLLTPESQIDSGDGTIEVGDHKFSDSHSIGRVDAIKAFAHSSNVCAIKTGMRVGKESFFGAIQKFGFGRPTGIELPAETAGIVRQPNRWNGDSLASMSIGYEIGVTALQMATSFATIANNGVRIRPHIIKEIKQSDQTKIYEAQPESVRVVSHQTAQNMRKLMSAVVTDGTGKRADLTGYTSAGKTGTAWKFDEKTKRVSGAKYVSSFIGFAPVDDPAVTIAIVMDEPKVGGRNGGQVSAPVFKEVAEGVLAEMRIPFDRALDDQPSVVEEIQETVGNGDTREPRGNDRPVSDTARSENDGPGKKANEQKKEPATMDRPRILTKPRSQMQKEILKAKDKFKT